MDHTKKQKSQNWDKYSNNYKNPDVFVEDFPFKEGFPSGGPADNVDKVFELILTIGRKYEAKVYYSGKFKAEGWQMITPTVQFPEGTTLDEKIVAAWREK